MKRHVFLLAALLVSTLIIAQPHKREMRGAWIATVANIDWPSKEAIGNSQLQQSEIIELLDRLQNVGINTIIFQVRPTADALYPSTIEPWSHWLTGRQGQDNDIHYDPLLFVLEQAHKRCIDVHVWINPYRVSHQFDINSVAENHIYRQHPEWFWKYGKQWYFEPGLDQTREFLCKVVADLVRRYDIDAIHMDDYFYPYPVAGVPIPDDAQYRQDSNGIPDRGDWRRYNVNLFIKQFYETVHKAKPWVKVGISPFGIYRNKKSSEIGSQTNGLQNYDDLYADVLLWVNNGWLDYCVPQIYWEIGNKAADYETLIRWWSKYASARPLYIGEDIERTVKASDPGNPSRHQQEAKQQLHRQMPAVKGTVLWYAKAAVDNVGNYGTMLRQQYWRYPALQPAMPYIDKKAPGKPRKVKPIWMPDGYVLFWTAPKGKKWNDEATAYVVYRFAKGEKEDINDPSHIVAITRQTFLQLPFIGGNSQYTYVVTALDRMHNESKGVKKKIKL